MLEAAGGGGGTDWWGMSMEQIHSLSQSPDIDSQYQIVDGWQKSADLISDHMAQVQDYRDSLAAAWPPAKSTASKIYLDRLDGLIKNLNETYEAALANRDALSSASLSLSLAKTQMATVYSQWDTNNKALLAFNQQQSQKASSGQPTPSPSPSGEEPPPVTATQQEALRQKAITLMSGVSSDLAEAQLKVVRPTPYDPAIGIEKGGSGGTGGGNVPVLPPIVPTYSGAGGGASSGSSSSPGRGSTTLPTTSGTATGTTGSAFPSGNGGNPGLVLGGTNPPSTTLPPPSTGLNPVTGLQGGGPVNNPGILPPGTGPFVPNGTPPRNNVGTFSGEGSGLKSIGDRLPEGGLRAMPPGGIIGKVPGAGLGEPGEGRFEPQRVNPVGGVIGEPGARGVGGGFNGEAMMGGGSPGGRGAGIGRGESARQAGRAGLRGNVSEQQSYGQAGGRRAGRRDRTDDVHWDPDNPWATEEGVDPVVLPMAEQRIDPGPAIGLI